MDTSFGLNATDIKYKILFLKFQLSIVFFQEIYKKNEDLIVNLEIKKLYISQMEICPNVLSNTILWCLDPVISSLKEIQKKF